MTSVREAVLVTKEVEGAQHCGNSAISQSQWLRLCMVRGYWCFAAGRRLLLAFVCIRRILRSRFLCFIAEMWRSCALTVYVRVTTRLQRTLDIHLLSVATYAVVDAQEM
jgi:hypothetical protein